MKRHGVRSGVVERNPIRRAIFIEIIGHWWFRAPHRPRTHNALADMMANMRHFDGYTDRAFEHKDGPYALIRDWRELKPIVGDF